MKKILMPIMESGAGHKMPALAVKSALETLYPHKYQIDIIDFAHAAGASKADKTIKKGWNFILAHPLFGKIGYVMLELFHFLPERFINIQLRDFKKKGIEYVKRADPDMVFAPHFFGTAISAMAKKKYRLKTKIIGYVTDPFDAYVWWATKMADAILVASEQAKIRLQKNGVALEKIKVFAFPININFAKVTREKNELIKEYGLDKKQKTILASIGGEGIGKTARYVKSIARANLPFNIILVCGKNEKLQKQMLGLKKNIGKAANLIVLGYVNNMNELHYISDVVMGKAGASATFEAIIMHVPIIFTDWACYNEKPNIDFCLKKGFGFYAANKKSLFKILNRIRTTSCLDIYKNNLRQFHFQSGALEIARYLDTIT
jgi:processive 1,2-diacylglycerol beta-glucosyltransferase